MDVLKLQLQATSQPPPLQTVLALFVLAATCHNYADGKSGCLKLGLPRLLSHLLADALAPPGGANSPKMESAPPMRRGVSEMSDDARDGFEARLHGLAEQETLRLHWTCICA